MITEGLIAVGILALIVALFLLGGRTKNRQANQHIRHKRATHQHSAALAEPSGSARTLTHFPMSTVDKSLSTLVEPLEVTKPLIQFDLYTPDDAQDLTRSSKATEETLTQFDRYMPDDMQNFAKPYKATKETQASSPMQTMAVTQTLVQEIQPIQIQVQQGAPDQAQVSAALNEQPTAKLYDDLPERQAQSGLASKIAPLPLSKPISRSLRRPPSIDEQMADLTADAWALQQQAAEIARRLSYLSACLQHSLASAPYEPDDNSQPS